MHHAKMPAGHLVFVTRSHKKQCRILIPRDAPVGHRRGNNPVEYVFIFFIPRDALVGHRRGNNPVEYVIFFFIFFFLLLVVTKSNVEY